MANTEFYEKYNYLSVSINVSTYKYDLLHMLIIYLSFKINIQYFTLRLTNLNCSFGPFNEI